MSTSTNATGININKAIHLHQSGSLEKADKIYARILKSKPRHSEALHMRGVLKLQQGQHQLAEHLLKKAVGVDQNDPWIKFHLAEVYAATEQHEEASTQFQSALDGGANEADVHYMYGNSLFQLGKLQEAIHHYEIALKLQPDDSDCRLNMANALEATGDLTAAIKLLEPLANHTDASVQIKLQFAELLVNAKKSLRAHSVLLDIKSIELNEIEKILSTAKFMHKQVRYESAEYLLDLTLPYKTELKQRHLDLSVGLLNDLGRYSEARSLLNNLSPAIERSAWSWFQQGICLQVSGEFKLASDCHSKALDSDDTLGAAAYSLASNESIDIVDQQLESWIEKIDNPKLEDDQQAQFAFAVARTLDKRKETKKAFENYLHANALVARSQPFNADNWDSYTDQIIETFNSDYFTKWSVLPPHPPSFENLSRQFTGQHLQFIVGMPRSGSTLLEQTIIKNTGIKGLGEHFAMRRIFADIPEITKSTQKMPLCTKELSEGDMHNLRLQYLATLASNSHSASGKNESSSTIDTRYVDKMLGNFVRLGVLAVMFPDARILHSCRNPMATSVSCFINAFSSGLKFTYDLYGMGRAWQTYERLMKHWHDVLPIKIMDVHYENLVSNPSNYQQEIFQFLDISETDKQNTSPHTSLSGETINTASFWQARQPISTDSIEAWTRFDAYLDPLREGLAYKRS